MARALVVTVAPQCGWLEDAHVVAERTDHDDDVVPTDTHAVLA